MTAKCQREREKNPPKTQIYEDKWGLSDSKRSTLNLVPWRQFWRLSPPIGQPSNCAVFTLQVGKRSRQRSRFDRHSVATVSPNSQTTPFLLWLFFFFFHNTIISFLLFYGLLPLFSPKTKKIDHCCFCSLFRSMYFFL